jgi:hypothetical protein
MAESRHTGDGIRLRKLIEIRDFDADRYWPDIPLLLLLGDEEGYASTGVLRIAGMACSSTSVIDLKNEVQSSPALLDALVVPVSSKVDLTQKLPVSVGRSMGRDVCINHGSISKFHAQFLPPTDHKGWRIRDCGSLNGTFVEGVRLGPDDVFLARGFSDITFGSLHCRFVHPSAVTALVYMLMDEHHIDHETPDPDVEPSPSRLSTETWGGF